MRPKKRRQRRQRRQDRLNQATLEEIIRENPDLFRGGSMQLLPEAEVEGTYGEVNERRGRRRREVIEDVSNEAKEIGFELIRMIPFLGEAIDVAEVGYAEKTGKDFYGDEASPEALAGIGVASLLLPNIIERPLKKAGRAIKRAFKAAPEEAPVKKAVPRRTAARIDNTMGKDGKELIVDYRDMTPDERVVQADMDLIKNDMDSPEGRRRIKDMIVAEANDILQQEVDGVHITQAVHEQARRVLRNPDALDRQVEVVLEGDPFLNKGVMNTEMSAGLGKPRAYYEPTTNRVNPGTVSRDGRSAADHELAHSVQYNILGSFGIQNPHAALEPGIQVGLQKEGFRTMGSRGTELDRQAVRGIQRSDDPSVIRKSQMPEALGIPEGTNVEGFDEAKFHNTRGAKAYWEEGYDVDPNNPLNPSEEIRFQNALRGHRTNEPHPMMVDLRGKMMREGVIGHRYDEITPEMIEQMRGDKRFANSGVLGMTDFKDPIARKFSNKRMSEIMNKLPALIPALAGAGYLSTQGGEQRQGGF